VDQALGDQLAHDEQRIVHAVDRAEHRADDAACLRAASGRDRVEVAVRENLRASELLLRRAEQLRHLHAEGLRWVEGPWWRRDADVTLRRWDGWGAAHVPVRSAGRTTGGG
jgi:hypothetical protein